MSSRKVTKAMSNMADQQLIDGVHKHLAGMSLVLRNQTFKAKDVEKFLQERIDTRTATNAARAVWHGLLDAEEAKMEETNVLVSALRQVVVAMFGSDVTKLADFGIAPRKQATLTPDKQVARIAQMRATREARHTMGPKKKAKIKGVVDETTPAIPTPAAPPPAPSPAAPAPVVVVNGAAKPDAANGAAPA